MPPTVLIHWPGLGAPSVAAPPWFGAVVLAVIALMDEAMKVLERERPGTLAQPGEHPRAPGLWGLSYVWPCGRACPGLAGLGFVALGHDSVDKAFDLLDGFLRYGEERVHDITFSSESNNGPPVYFPPVQIKGYAGCRRMPRFV